MAHLSDARRRYEDEVNALIEYQETRYGKIDPQLAMQTRADAAKHMLLVEALSGLTTSLEKVDRRLLSIKEAIQQHRRG